MTDMRNQPEVYGLGLGLRPWDVADAAVLLRGVTDPEFRRWNTVRRPVTDLESARAAIERRAEAWRRDELAQFAVLEDGAVVGGVGITRIDRHMRRSGVGYWVLPERRRRGIATRALELCSRWAFEQENLHRIELGHALENAGSCRVAERCGYLYEGTRRGAMHQAQRIGTYRDQHLHARLASDAYPEVDQPCPPRPGA
ncbi:GNAT family N-acetyltransferase [Streptomyces sp. NBC_01387]|uniref:GNAT family N-acetyltransferase n=1 Tax=unclassified Streptomyces TaxID=2593676 RepID=UPI002023DDDE|nr:MULTISPECIES: GNAT family protein [unclassified Streptomyces]MCX4550234.1 GNAT family N-acetyltransferase [Streptomyces sp. NBC_01500]WSC21728.1 GNAT family N-acetyltransferase [Streptomyces sp. NBC_01766]WSV55687.1 GNAT family N-acetyltransferase [Streptomyces sp. NBC_01014]